MMKKHFLLLLLMVLPVVAGAQNTSRRAIPGSYDLGNVIDLINYLTGKDSDGYDAAKADMNGDGKVDVSDVVSMVNIAIRDSEMNADFGSPENARQYLVNLYHMQRFGLPHTGGGSYPKNTNRESSYTGHLDALTDCYQLHWYGASIYNNYYNGNFGKNQGAAEPMVTVSARGVDRWTKRAESVSFCPPLNIIITINIPTSRTSRTSRT